MDENYIEVRGKKVFYRSEMDGNVEKVLLLHGMSFTSKNWVDIEALRKISQWGYDTIAVDYPGFGLSEKNENFSFSGRDYKPSSLFVNDFCKALEIDKVVIIGPSMGGAITIRTLIDYPELVSQIFVVAPAGFEALKSELYRIDKPVRIIWGSDDTTIDISYGRKYHDLIAGSSIHIIKGADHAVYLRKTSQFFSLIKKFLLDE